MRPPEFTGGNWFRPYDRNESRLNASMRPPEFTGGNIAPKASRSGRMVTLQ